MRQYLESLSDGSSRYIFKNHADVCGFFQILRQPDRRGLYSIGGSKGMNHRMEWCAPHPYSNVAHVTCYMVAWFHIH